MFWSDNFPFFYKKDSLFGTEKTIVRRLFATKRIQKEKLSDYFFNRDFKTYFSFLDKISPDVKNII